MGLTGFSAAVFVGILAGNPGVTTLGRALLCMLACTLVGRLLGSMGATAAGEFVDRYKSEHPAPNPPARLVELQDRRNRHNQIVDEMKRAA